MEAYRYFNLNRPPFEARPDPAFFYETSSHGEALATVQYTVHAGKACGVVLGDSGSGKTLVGRLLADNVNRKARVLWIHGIGQPADGTEVAIHAPGTMNGPYTMRRARPESSTLAAWLRTVTSSSPVNVIIVDNADGLPKHSWTDLLALLTREFRATRPTTLILMGLPSLVERLARPSLVRLRRRIFRTCELTPFARPDTEAYIRHRLARAGNDDTPFTPAALDMVYRLSAGNPALINQICDNALVEAYGAECRTIDTPHILATVQAITGPRPRRPRLKDPKLPRLGAAIRSVLPEEAPGATALPDAATETAPAEADAPPPEPELAAQEVRFAAAGEDDACTPLNALLAGPVSRPISALAPRLPELPAPGTPHESACWSLLPITRRGDPASGLLLERLRLVETRIAAALSRVRGARARQYAALSARPAPVPAPQEVPAARDTGTAE